MQQIFKKARQLALFILVFVFVLALGACKTGFEKFEPNISELRDNVFDSSNDVMKINIISGFRENPYILDGNCTGTTDFTVITVTPVVYEQHKIYTYSIKIGEKEYIGELSQHPFGRSYSADLEVRCNEQRVTCVISDDGTEYTFELETKRTQEMITAEKAIEIAQQRLKTQIQSLTLGGQLNAEIYIRLMSNPIDNSGGYYWYVAFVGNEQLVYAVLINPFSMEIAAIRD